MLVLTRKADEQIVIGDNITVTVVSVRGGMVRLGFEAPKEILIYRSEVFEAIQRDKDENNSKGNAIEPGTL